MNGLVLLAEQLDRTRCADAGLDPFGDQKASVARMLGRECCQKRHIFPTSVTSTAEDKFLRAPSNLLFAVFFFLFVIFCEKGMDKMNERMQTTPLWTVLRAASSWMSKVTVRTFRFPFTELVCMKAPDGVASVGSSPRNNAAEKVRPVANAPSTVGVLQYDAFDRVGITGRAELAAGHVLDATKDVLADLRERIAEARGELEAIESELAERKAELAANVGDQARGDPCYLLETVQEKEVADSTLQREIASADAEFLVWRRQEFEPQLESMQWEWEALQQKVIHPFTSRLTSPFLSFCV